MVIAEVDEDASAYHRSHIPGAVFFDWRDHFQDPLRRTFVEAAAFEQLMDSRGIRNDTHVVLYGASDNRFAAFAYWYFKYYGHERVSLLDGGRRLWELQDRPLSVEAVDWVATSGYRVTQLHRDVRVTRDQILSEFLDDRPDKILLDCRSPGEYSGEVVNLVYLSYERDQVGGHIPGAVNVPSTQATRQDTGEFLPREELERLHKRHGLTKEADIVTYCRIGDRSALMWFVLHELFDFPRVRNYDGSWTEWGSLVDVPVAR